MTDHYDVYVQMPFKYYDIEAENGDEAVREAKKRAITELESGEYPLHPDSLELEWCERQKR